MHSSASPATPSRTWYHGYVVGVLRFPAVVAQQATTIEAGDKASADEPSGKYTSVELEAELSGAEVDRLIAKGYAVNYEKWEDVTSAFGGALVSKLACIIKVRDDRTRKVRNVLDLRRSGYNEMVSLPERVVLPRLRDLLHDARALARGTGVGEE